MIDRRKLLIGAIALTATPVLPAASATPKVFHGLTRDKDVWMASLTSEEPKDRIINSLLFDELGDDIYGYVTAPTFLLENRLCAVRTNFLKSRWTYDILGDLMLVSSSREDAESKLMDIITDEIYSEIQTHRGVLHKVGDLVLREIVSFKAVDSESFQPYIGFKIRYAGVSLKWTA